MESWNLASLHPQSIIPAGKHLSSVVSCRCSLKPIHCLCFCLQWESWLYLLLAAISRGAALSSTPGSTTSQTRLRKHIGTGPCKMDFELTMANIRRLVNPFLLLMFIWVWINTYQYHF
jgi:hypothetical protein